MTVKTVPNHEAAPTISNKLVSVSYGCKSPDGQHIFGENGRCLMCWRMQPDTNQTSRVLMIVISSQNSEQRRVDELAEILESQVRGIFNTVALIQRESHNPSQKPVELEVYAS